MMTLSDAAGAATGACLGIYFGTQLFGEEGAVIGGIIGSTVVGAVSSAEGFKKDQFCVVISITDIINKIKNKLDEVKNV